MQPHLLLRPQKVFQAIVGKNLMVFALALLAIGLPLSKFLVGASQFLLLLNWVLEGDFSRKLTVVKSNKLLWIFLLLPLLHIFWFFNTTDFAYGLHDLKIKLPLLVFPLLLSTSQPLTKKELYVILKAFVASVLIASFIISLIVLGIYKYPHSNIREASIFISHIRFGLMVLFSIVISAQQAYEQYAMSSRKWFWGYLIASVWLLFFMVVLQSVTSWVVFFLLSIVLFIIYYRRIKWRYLRIACLVIIIFFVGSSITLVIKVYYKFYHTQNAKFSELPKQTPRGNLYLNDTLSQTKENGHYVKILISYKEMSETWPLVSKTPFTGRDAKGYPIWTTLVRYLASKGLPKDRDGVLALEPEDVAMIEKGYASCVYRMNFIPYVKTYEIIWELDRYFKSGDANNKSVAQRFEYWKTAGTIIKNNFWVGVGTGDVAMSFKDTYQQLNSKLRPENRLRAHNQYLTFFLTFGLAGFLAALFSMFYPAKTAIKRSNFLAISFLFVIFVSMCNEDTLETQAGVTFYIFFYTLLTYRE